MVSTILLSGGIGQRFQGNVPKQYVLVNEKPIIGYCMDTIQKCNAVDQLIVVADESWNLYLCEYINKNNIAKFAGFASAGISRQHSIFNGLMKIYELGGKDDDLIVIHDAARPNVTTELIEECISMLEDYDMSIPVLSVKDTVYFSDNGKEISNLINRDYLYAGQSPEGCHLGKYYSINKALSDTELLSVRGTSEIGFKYGLSVGMFQGDEKNYKITTRNDLYRFISQINGD